MCYRDYKSITRNSAVFDLHRLSPAPSSGHTVLPRGDCYHKFSRRSIIHDWPVAAFRAWVRNRVWPRETRADRRATSTLTRWVWLPALVGSGVIAWAAADLQWMVHVTEVGVAFSYWLLSVTVGEELGDRS